MATKNKQEIDNTLDGFFSQTPIEEKKIETTNIADTPVPTTKEATVLTPQEETELKEKIAKKQNSKRGRPKKWEDGKRADGYERTSFIVNSEKMAKAREIALREALTQKELIEYALDVIITNYEAKHGIVIPRDSNTKKDVASIF